MFLILLARPRGFEPLTFAFGGQRSLNRRRGVEALDYVAYMQPAVKVASKRDDNVLISCEFRSAQVIQSLPHGEEPRAARRLEPRTPRRYWKISLNCFLMRAPSRST